MALLTKKQYEAKVQKTGPQSDISNRSDVHTAVPEGGILPLPPASSGRSFKLMYPEFSDGQFVTFKVKVPVNGVLVECECKDNVITTEYQEVADYLLAQGYMKIA